MVHGITESDRVGIVGSKGWHGLGKAIKQGMNAVEGFEDVGILFPTELVPIYAEVQRGVDIEGNPILRRIHLGEHLAHIRGDNDAPLGVVSKGYAQVTNRDLAGLLDSLAGEDAASKLESAGSLFGGRRVFGCIKLPTVIRTASDIVETYVVASNGHGGYAGLNVYPTSIRPECANMLRWSERDLGKGISFRHTGDMAGKVKQARVALDLAHKEVAVFEKQVQALAATELSVGQAKAFLAMSYDQTFGELPDPKEQPEAYAKLLAKRGETLARWEELLSHPTNAKIEGTAWGALNAITYWHDHERGRMSADSDQRLSSRLFGVANRDKQRALKLAMGTV